ncbi:MAG: CoA transferase [Candidatus Velthaea sp.]
MRVLETATMLAAPFCGMLLADHGAELIKIELPDGGDAMRSYGYQKGGVPLFWKMLARNKQSVTLDLRVPRGREIFLKLVATADVLIENFRPGTLDKWGLTRAELLEAKPDLIVARISGFGQTGPRSAQPGFGTLAEAMSGFAAMNGWADGPPTLPPFGMADSIAGLTAAFGVAAAVLNRNRTGAGQEIDIALYEPLLTLLGSHLVDYQQLGVIPERMGNTLPFAAPRNVYPTRDDRWIAVSCSTQRTTERLLNAIGLGYLLAEERFRDNRRRVENAAALDERITAWMKERDYAEIFALLNGVEVTAGPVYSPPDILEDAHVRARGSIVTVQDDTLGEMVMQAPIPRMTGTPGAIAFTGRTTPGQDNAAVFGSILGMPETELAALAGERVI